MKKLYIKPAITFESLAVTAAVASGCALLGTNSAEYQCPVIDEESGWTLFSSNAICMITPAPDDTICYDIPLANSNVFQS